MAVSDIDQFKGKHQWLIEINISDSMDGYDLVARGRCYRVRGIQLSEPMPYTGLGHRWTKQAIEMMVPHGVHPIALDLPDLVAQMIKEDAGAFKQACVVIPWKRFNDMKESIKKLRVRRTAWKRVAKRLFKEVSWRRLYKGDEDE